MYVKLEIVMMKITVTIPGVISECPATWKQP